MILSDNQIIQAMRLEEDDPKRLIIEPFRENHVQPASYDITLGNSFTVRTRSDKPIDIKKPVGGYKKGYYDEFILYPKDFVLATTLEYVKLPDYITAQVQGRSSLGRLGLFIQNAGWVDPGFCGEITLELYNAGKTPIKLEKGMRIGQLIFAETSPVNKPYDGKYKGQRGATPSSLFKDYEEDNHG